MLSLLSGVVNTYGIESSNTRVAAITFGGTATLQFGFTTYTKRKPIQTALAALTYSGGAAKLGAYVVALACSPNLSIHFSALNLTFTTLQTTGRPDAKKVVIIISADE